MHLFQIRFQYETNLNKEDTEYFLRVAPHLWKELYRDSITFDVIRLTLNGPTNMSLVLNLSPAIQANGMGTDEEMRSLGIRDPKNVRANMDLQLWLIQLQRDGLQASWDHYSSQRALPFSPVPIRLKSYGISTYKDHLFY